VYRDIPDDLRVLIEPVVGDHDCELVDVEVLGGGSQGLLRVTLDSVSGDGRISIECCAEVSRELQTQLDVADVMQGAYRLEVSSPGLDRVLAREKDFGAAVGEEVKIRTRRPLEGRRRFRGTLVSFEDESARVLIDGKQVEIPFDEIEKANILYQFSRADFAERARK
jgi:ribosome maturation factor RimP